MSLECSVPTVHVKFPHCCHLFTFLLLVKLAYSYNGFQNCNIHYFAYSVSLYLAKILVYENRRLTELHVCCKMQVLCLVLQIIVNYALNYASIIRQTQPYGKCLLVVVLMQVKSGLRLKKCPV